MRGDGKVDRTALLDRWFELTRPILPAIAPPDQWQILYDHCLMRVCLDEAVGAPWPKVIRRPATRHMIDDQLAAAVDVAVALATRPELIVKLNAKSLRRRAAWK